MPTERLGQLCDVLDSKRKPVTKRDRVSGPYPYYGATGVQDYVAQYLFDEPLVLVGEDGAKWNSGDESAFAVTGKVWVNNHAHVLRPNRSRVLDKWLIYVLNYSDLTPFVSGLTVPKLNQASLRDIPIPLPPLEAQKRIVAILEETFDAIGTSQTSAEKNLLNAKELFESYREGILSSRCDGWLEARLGAICDIKHGYAFEGEYFTSDGDYVLLTPGNFYETGGYRDRGDKQKYYIGPIPDGFVLMAGDLLVAMTEQAAGLLGSPLLVPQNNRFLHNQRLGLVVGRPSIPWHNGFFFHVFNTRRVRDEIHRSASGVKVRHTSPKKIGDVRVFFPDTVEEQRRISESLFTVGEECKRLADIYSAKGAACDNLKASVLHRAFSGRLTA